MGFGATGFGICSHLSSVQLPLRFGRDVIDVMKHVAFKTGLVTNDKRQNRTTSTALLRLPVQLPAPHIRWPYISSPRHTIHEKV